MLAFKRKECRDKEKGNERKTRKKRSGVNSSPKGLRLKERDVENRREGGCYVKEEERASSGKTRTMPVFVSSLSLWHFGGQTGCVCVYLVPPSTQFVELIHSLIVSKTEKVSLIQPLFITETGERRRRKRRGEKYNLRAEVQQKPMTKIE